MAQERISQALARIEAAQARIDKAADARSSMATGEPEKIEHKFNDLRNTVTSNIARLDQLIERLEK